MPPPFGLPDDFSAELAAEMESFMKELAGEGMPDAAGSTADMPDDEKAFRDAFQKMLVSDLEATGLDGVPAVSSAAGPSAPTGSGQGFQEAIRETIERLKNTETSSKVCTLSTIHYKADAMGRRLMQPIAPTHYKRYCPS